jgi:hypothetical protein
MEARMYSKREEAAWIFSDLLSCVGRRGWFSAGPIADDGKSLLYVSFHMHPDDADNVFTLIQNAILSYGGSTEWALERQRHNRFVLCPLPMDSRARQLGNFGSAAEEIRREIPLLQREAASDLILLSDFLYKSYLEVRDSLQKS